MQSADTSASVSRHGTYYIHEGDIIMRAENTLFRIHSFHLQRDTTYFDDPIAGLDANPGQGYVGSIDANPLPVDDVNAIDFEHLLWFFYESAYNWSRSTTVDPALAPKWESILRLADKFGMQRSAKVACYALGRAGALSDVRKIALCTRYGMGKDWIVEELKRIVSRDAPLTPGEAVEIGSPIAVAAVAAAREELPLAAEKCSSTGKCWEAGHDDDDPDVVCVLGVHTCNKLHQKACPMLSEVSARDAVDDMLTDENLFVFVRMRAHPHMQVEGKSYRLHSYHLKRASKIFSDMYLLPKSTRAKKHVEGATPLDVKAEDFMNLIWYFYESPYETPTVPDPSTSRAKWESVLRLADLFDMEEAAQVATYALDRCNALGDVRKIALCVRHNIRLEWALEALKNVCGREQGLSVAEAREVGADMIALLALARERFFR
ncbi:hypothetical protein K525DRAFT_172405, partial [Schizophyllum commune Loenen D]